MNSGASEAMGAKAEIVRVRGNKYFVWVKTRNDTQEVFRAKFIMVSWGEEKKGARA